VLRQGRRRRAVRTGALVGYTNAGKSSLLRALTGENAFVEDRLFATLDTLTREADLGAGKRIRLVDTVGFIRKLPHHLVASFRATLEEAAEADVLLHLIDAADPSWQEHVEVVDLVLADLGLQHARVIHVFNKIDLLTDEEREARCADIVSRLDWQGPVFSIAAVSKQGTRELVFAIMQAIENKRQAAAEIS